MVDLLGPADAGAVRTLAAAPADTTNPAAADSFFQDCTPGVANTGTPLTARWGNRILTQIRRAIRGIGVVEGNLDGDMLLKAILKASARGRNQRVVVTATGAGSWTVPAGVYSVTFRVWAGGGGGGFGASANGAAAGGGGGEYAEITLDVTPGQVITYVIGAGGAAGVLGTNGAAGGDSTITIAGVTYTVHGGAGAVNANAGQSGNSAAGGAGTTAPLPSQPGDASEGGIASLRGGRGANGGGPQGGRGGLGGTGGAANTGQERGGGGGGGFNGQAAGAGGRGESWFEYAA